ncbi:hypothetical protein ASF69_09930 [Rhizobium sp. Leaf311]|nr:hypothetical protein ASF69_09930 [Rhizobium sp. Leaf311]
MGLPQALDFGPGTHIPDFGIIDRYETRTLIDASTEFFRWRPLPFRSPNTLVGSWSWSKRWIKMNGFMPGS